MDSLKWSELKILLDTVKPPLFSVKEDSDFIYLFTIVQGIRFDCILQKNTDDYSNYESTYSGRLNLTGSYDVNGKIIVSNYPFSDAAGFRFRGTSFTGTALAESTTDIDYKLVNERYINGGRLLVSNIGSNDKLTFQVVDVENVLGFGENVVLDEFITDYYVPTSGNLEVKLDYPAKIMSGLYVRLKYTNSTQLDTLIKCNLYLHWKSS